MRYINNICHEAYLQLKKKCVLKGVELTLLKGWSDQKQLAIDIGNLRKKQLVARIGMALTHIWKVNQNKWLEFEWR